jgi:hypothetical protein
VLLPFSASGGEIQAIPCVHGMVVDFKTPNKRQPIVTAKQNRLTKNEVNFIIW